MLEEKQLQQPTSYAVGWRQQQGGQVESGAYAGSACDTDAPVRAAPLMRM